MTDTPRRYLIDPNIITHRGAIREDELKARLAAYALLWASLQGPGAWDENPWVAANSFTVAQRNIDQMGGGDG